MEDVRVPFASGRTAEIFDLGDGRVAKLFLGEVDRETVLQEIENMRHAHILHVRVPWPARLVETGGRLGIEMPKIEGRNGMDQILANLDAVERLAEEFADLQIRLTAKSGVGLRDRKMLMASRIVQCGLDARSIKTLLGLCKELPDGDRLVHGDLHPGNILYPQEGPVVIDWVDACCGHPMSDVARTVVLFGWGGPAADAVQKRYVDAYLKAVTPGGVDDDLRRWLLVTAAARLAEKASESQPYLRRWVLSQLGGGGLRA